MNTLVTGASTSTGVRGEARATGEIVTHLETQPPALPLVPELVWHPVDLAQPDRASARGQPSTQPAADVVALCPRAGVW